MARTIKNPIRFETGGFDPESGRKILVDIYPPGNVAYIRTERDKAPTTQVDFVSVYMAAKCHKPMQDEGKEHKPPVKIVEPSVPTMIHDLLAENKKLHILKIRKALKEKGANIERRVIQDILGLMKDVKQEDSFHFTLQEAANN